MIRATGIDKLAPVASPPLPTAADKLPTAQIKLPPGFNIEVYSSGIANARSLRVGDKGTVFVGTRFGCKRYARHIRRHPHHLLQHPRFTLKRFVLGHHLAGLTPVFLERWV